MQFLFMNLIFVVFGYIPHSHFILQQWGNTHGKGTYQVQQEVLFQASGQRIIVQETWTIDSGLQMHLEAKGPGILYTAKYDFNNKYILNTKGELNKIALQPDFFENLFYLNEAKDLARRLYNMKIADAKILTPQKRFYHLSQVEYKGQDYIKLARMQEKTSYSFKSADLNRNKESEVGFWISQDDFYLLQINLPSQVQISASDYEAYTNNLNLPKVRHVEYSNNKIPIQILSVNRIGQGRDTKALISPDNSSGLKPIHFSDEQLSPAITDFYRRFR